jgi:hypothetical protein
MACIFSRLGRETADRGAQAPASDDRHDPHRREQPAFRKQLHKHSLPDDESVAGRWVSWTANLKLSGTAQLIAMAAGIPLPIVQSTCNSNHGLSIVMAALWPTSETTSDASAPGRPRNLLRVSGAGKSAQPNGFWRGWHRGDPYGFRNPDHVWNQGFLDEATKVPLVLVPAIRVQPRSALLQQVGSQWDSFDRNRSEQLANRCERFTRADRHKGLVTFIGAQVRLGSLSQRPGQVGFMHNLLHHHHPLVDRSAQSLGQTLVAAKKFSPLPTGRPRASNRHSS